MYTFIYHVLSRDDRNFISVYRACGNSAKTEARVPVIQYGYHSSQSYVTYTCLRNMYVAKQIALEY